MKPISEALPADHRRRAQRLRLGPRPAPSRVPRPQGQQRRGGVPGHAGGGGPHRDVRPADAPDHRRRAAGQRSSRSIPRPSGCSSLASPTWSRSSPRSTRGTSIGFLKKPWQPEELEAAVRQAAAEYDRLTELRESAKNSKTWSRASNRASRCWRVRCNGSEASRPPPSHLDEKPREALCNEAGRGVRGRARRASEAEVDAPELAAPGSGHPILLPTRAVEPCMSVTGSTRRDAGCPREIGPFGRGGSRAPRAGKLVGRVNV